MEALLAFAAALLALRLSGLLLRHWRERREPQFAAWAAGLGAYAVASAALAWGAASGWSDSVFRVYYLFGGLLTAALLGVGSLLLRRLRWASPLGLVYAGLAAGVAVAVPLTAPVTGSRSSGTASGLSRSSRSPFSRSAAAPSATGSSSPASRSQRPEAGWRAWASPRRPSS
jgi:hypothetical protein